MTYPGYSTGLVSITAGATVIVGTGTGWNTNKVRAGDDIIVAGHTAFVEDVIDGEHIGIAAWSHDPVANAAYRTRRVSTAWIAGADALLGVTGVLGALNARGFIVTVLPDETVPDPSWGEEGQIARQESTGKKWLKQNGVWDYRGITDAVFSRYDLTADIPGRPESGAVVASWIVPSNMIIGAGLPQSVGKAVVAAADVATFKLARRDGEQFGTATFAAGSRIPVMACPTPVTFQASDVIDLIAPFPRDATLANIVFAFLALR